MFWALNSELCLHVVKIRLNSFLHYEVEFPNKFRHDQVALNAYCKQS